MLCCCRSEATLFCISSWSTLSLWFSSDVSNFCCADSSSRTLADFSASSFFACWSCSGRERAFSFSDASSAWIAANSSWSFRISSFVWSATPWNSSFFHDTRFFKASRFRRFCSNWLRVSDDFLLSSTTFVWTSTAFFPTSSSLPLVISLELCASVAVCLLTTNSMSFDSMALCNCCTWLLSFCWMESRFYVKTSLH